jgi:kynurenine formamidase
MRIRSFIIAYALVLAILVFADRRPGSMQQDHYSHVVDLTDGQAANAPHTTASDSRTRIIAPAALIPGTWSAGQIPAERLVAPLVVLDLNLANTAVAAGAAVEGSPQISLDDIAAWEAHHGMIPQGAVVAIRRTSTITSTDNPSARPLAPFPVARDAAMFLIEARNTIGFAVETPVDLTSDRNLARQLALHGDYVVERSARLTAMPATGSLIIVAPARNKRTGEAPVRILAMVR